MLGSQRIRKIDAKKCQASEGEGHLGYLNIAEKLVINANVWTILIGSAIKRGKHVLSLLVCHRSERNDVIRSMAPRKIAKNHALVVVEIEINTYSRGKRGKIVSGLLVRRQRDAERISLRGIAPRLVAIVRIFLYIFRNY